MTALLWLWLRHRRADSAGALENVATAGLKRHRSNMMTPLEWFGLGFAALCFILILLWATGVIGNSDNG